MVTPHFCANDPVPPVVDTGGDANGYPFVEAAVRTYEKRSATSLSTRTI